MSTHGTVWRGASRAPRPAGFTLVELLLVMALVVVLLGMSYPTLRRSLGSYRLREAAKTMRVQVARARLAAIESGVPQEMRFIPGEGVFRLGPARGYEPDADDLSGATDPEAGPRLTAAGDPRRCGAPADGRYPSSPASGVDEQLLPESIIFAHEQPRAAEASSASAPFGAANSTNSAPSAAGDELAAGDERSWSSPIVFRPDGTTIDAQFVIANDRQQCIVLSLRGLTGALDQSELQSLEEMQAAAEAAAPVDRLARLPATER
ncbi:MAG: prepilin-type N-terminal cleavage/methylation domain-containing protein [Pirellulales bacterium]|nr:prepilin-type N-terminal cleavage/methylation domain-containing protein [Pirellulales bacterium]